MAAGCILWRSRRGRWSFLAPPQELLDVFIVLLAEHASSLLALEEEVVCRGDVVEPIPLELLLRFVSIYVVIINEHAHDLRVNRNRFFSEVDRRRIRWLMLADGVPGVIPNVLDRVALGWVWIQDVTDQVLGLLR